MLRASFYRDLVKWYFALNTRFRIIISFFFHEYCLKFAYNVYACFYHTKWNSYWTPERVLGLRGLWNMLFLWRVVLEMGWLLSVYGSFMTGWGLSRTMKVDLAGTTTYRTWRIGRMRYNLYYLLVIHTWLLFIWKCHQLIVYLQLHSCHVCMMCDSSVCWFFFSATSHLFSK